VLAIDSFAKRLTRDEWHRVVEKAVRLTSAEDRYEMRMAKPGRDLNLTPEPLGVDSARKLGRKHLEHDPSVECSLAGHENPRHSTTAKLPLDLVGRPD
jgi:hypothetical protein